MSGEFFFEADEVLAFGNPWHGYREKTGGALKTDSGQAITGTVTDDLPDDGWNRFTDFSAPAFTTPVADAALGMTWLNKAVWVGYDKLVAAVHSPGSGLFSVGAVNWPYKASDGTVWWLCSGVNAAVSTTQLKIYARQMPMFKAVALGVDATEVASISILEGQWGAMTPWVNFSPDGSKAAIHGGADDGFGGLQGVSAWECTVTGGSASTPPTVSLAVSGEDFSLQYSVTGDALLRGYPTSTSQTLWDPVYGNYEEITYTGVVTGGGIDPSPSPQSTSRTIREWAQVRAIVYSPSGQRLVLSTLRRITNETKHLCLSASGVGDMIPGSEIRFFNSSVSIVYELSDFYKWEIALCVDGGAVETVTVEDVTATRTETLSGIDQNGYLIHTTSDTSSSNKPFQGLGDHDLFLASGDAVVFAIYDPPMSIISYANSRAHGQFSAAGLPTLSTLNDFSTHPITGVFDASKDRYF